MENKPTLGEKIRFFRTQKKLSQSDLELDSDLSFGTVSRIECDQINPTKETIIKIAKALDLTSSDIEYLLEFQNANPTKEEIDKVIQKVKPMLNEEIFPGYLRDNKHRLWAYNKMLTTLFEIPDTQENRDKYLGWSVLKILFSPDFNIRKKIPLKYLNKILAEQVSAFRALAGKYSSEESMQGEIAELLKDDEFKSIWDKELLNHTEAQPKADFFILYKGKTLEIMITRSPLTYDSRFIYTEYIPKNKETAEVFEKIRETVNK